ncbi:MAG: CPBP family intramembrane metalloprotease [Methanosarcinales archaeon]|nr:MAG: CPBP family intramembrane metalloprotease [Methanosarcinales archaeon]
MPFPRVKLDQKIIDFILHNPLYSIFILFGFFYTISFLTIPTARGVLQKYLTGGLALSLDHILATSSLPALFLVIAAIKMYNKNLKDLCIARRPDSWSYKKSVLYGLISAIILAAMGIVVYKFVRGGEIPRAFEPNIYIIFGLLFGTFYEEVIFRSCLQNLLKIQLGDVRAIIVQTILFVVLHPPERILYYIAFTGVVFGLLMYKSRSIVPGYVAHLGLNVILFSLT